MDESELGSPELLAMAKCLTEALASDSVVESWDDMDMMDRSAMLKACEVLLANWPILERARGR